MEWWLVLLIIFAGLIILMATGLPVAFTFMTVNVIGVFILLGGISALPHLANSLWGGIASFVFLPIPMFVLLGDILFNSGIAMRAIDEIDKWLGRLPGRLGVVTLGVSTFLSVMSGNSTATTALLGQAFLPEMDKRGYNRSLSIGAITGTSGLAMIIPPSMTSVILASIAGLSVGNMLIGGIVPGILLAVILLCYILGRCLINPSLAPAYEVKKIPLKVKLGGTAKYILPLFLIVFAVTGLMLLGLATPSESAAVGVIAGAILAAAYGSLNWKMITSSLKSTTVVTVMILMIVAGSKSFSEILAYTGAARGLGNWAVNLPVPPILLIIIMLLVVGVLGMFMGVVALLMITMPIFVPVVTILNFDPIWFGILVLIMTEMAAITPPFGAVLFAMKGVAPPDVTLAQIIRAVVPYIICDLVVIAILMVFPFLVWY
ncbi:MAG: TRAP transporter large permease subunit [Peptococcaceae bacterium]|jgi:tripartite ATP-independent transporter DctM subunit|nr:TRAP transporter large permease subunit [Peptococcaceae bacterium]